jgi:predicted nucleotidyltransferase
VYVVEGEKASTATAAWYHSCHHTVGRKAHLRIVYSPPAGPDLELAADGDRTDRIHWLKMTDPTTASPQNQLSEAPPSALDRLRTITKRTWSNIAAADKTSREKMDALTQMAGRNLLPADEAAFVVFGSLARSEFTNNSDLDWAILIDGRADSRHLEIVQKLRGELVPAGFKLPGPTEIFGGLVFSHELIHAIGGDEDTNRNMTRRLLLLLESAAVPVSQSAAVHNRIIQGILYRYVEEDASFLNPSDPIKKIPRFLLNDVVRFWRTMAVDYANKYRARAGQKWALRNVKLRMSRKLLFVSGLFMCLSWRLDPRPQSMPKLLAQELVDHLRNWTARAPLESLAMVVEKYAPSLATNIFDSYDSFLNLLNDDRVRKSLEELSPEEAYRDKAFMDAREHSHAFDDALTRLLFESKEEVSKLFKRYGVF